MKTYVIMISRVFLKGHEREGEFTKFVEKILDNIKIHTLRSNIELWEKRFEKIEAGNACISLRYWEGKPYKSKQIEFKRLTKEDGIGLEVLEFDPITKIHPLFNKKISKNDIANEYLIAKNDGLFYNDFLIFFEKVKGEVAIIHFTKFRYIN